MDTTATLADLLEDDLRKFRNNIAKFTIQKMADDLTETAKKAIEDFYSHYDPEDPSNHDGRIYYYRHWNFRKSFKRYYENHSPRYIGGVELLVDDLPNVYHDKGITSPATVFWRVYQGYHGIASYQGYVPIMSPSPIEIIKLKYDDIYDNRNNYFNDAVQKALKDNYNIIA